MHKSMRRIIYDVTSVVLPHDCEEHAADRVAPYDTDDDDVVQRTGDDDDDDSHIKLLETPSFDKLEVDPESDDEEYPRSYEVYNNDEAADLNDLDVSPFFLPRVIILLL